jgi:hypothetical protein
VASPTRDTPSTIRAQPRSAACRQGADRRCWGAARRRTTASRISRHASIASLPFRSSDSCTCPQKLHIQRPVAASTATYRLRKAPQPWHRSAARRSHLPPHHCSSAPARTRGDAHGERRARNAAAAGLPDLVLSSGAANGWMTNPKGRPSGIVSELRVGTVCALKRQHGSTVLPRISSVCSGCCGVGCDEVKA